MKKIFLFLSIVLLIISCKNECYTQPEPILLEFVNANGENKLENQEIGPYSITRKTSENNYMSVVAITTEDHKIRIEKEGNYNGTREYRFASSYGLVTFFIKSSPTNDGCEGYKIDEVYFEQKPYSKENGFYRIVLD